MRQRRLSVAQLFLRALPIVHVHDCAVPPQDTPLLVAQRERPGYAPAVREIGSVECANLDSVRGTGSDTGHPHPSRLSDIIWMEKFHPTATHDFLGREAGVIEHASVAVIDHPFRRGAPEHLRNGFRQLSQVEFALPQFLFRSFRVGDVTNEGAKDPIRTQSHGCYFQLNGKLSAAATDGGDLDTPSQNGTFSAGQEVTQAAP